MKKILSITTGVILLSTAAFATNNHNNSNPQNQGQQQGQLQGQIGINKSYNKNYNKSESEANSSSYSKNYNKAEGGNAENKTFVKTGDTKAYGGDSKSFAKTGDSESSVFGSGNSENITDSSSQNKIKIDGDSYEAPDIPVGYAISPNLTATSDCIGSVSAGGSGQYFGFSLGGTTQSKPCNVREFAKMNANNPQLYGAILCQDSVMKEAFKVTGDYNKFCVGDKRNSTHKTWYGANKPVYKQGSYNYKTIGQTDTNGICDYPTEQCKKAKALGLFDEEMK